MTDPLDPGRMRQIKAWLTEVAKLNGPAAYTLMLEKRIKSLETTRTMFVGGTCMLGTMLGITWLTTQGEKQKQSHREREEERREPMEGRER